MTRTLVCRRRYIDFKARDFFARDGDYDGRVEDGTPYERRSRTLSHAVIGQRAQRRSLTALAHRLRDMSNADFEAFFAELDAERLRREQDPKVAKPEDDS